MLGSGTPCSGRERGGVAPPSQGLAVLRRGGQRWLGVGGLLATAMSCLPSLGRDAQGLYISVLPKGECV